MMQFRTVSVGLGDIQVHQGNILITCAGIGSGLVACVFDPQVRVGGVTHIMLPERPEHRQEARPGMFANSAVPEMVCLMEELGADRTRLIVRLAGGAQILRFSEEGAGLDMGTRNLNAVVAAFSLLGIDCDDSEVGGSFCRTIDFSVESGDVLVSSFSIKTPSPLEALAA